MSKPLIIVTEDIDATALEWLRDRCEVVECPLGGAGHFDDLIVRADGLVVRTYTHVDSDLLSAARKLRVVGRAGVGLDNIDVSACRERRIEVVHTPDANTQAVAEYVFALILDAVRPRVHLDKPCTLADWSRLRRGQIAQRQLSEMTLGIIGLGRVGKRVARVARGFGMDVVYSDVIDIAEHDRQGAKPLSLHEVLHTSDILSVHVDAREGNRGFINSAAFARMKPDALFINTSRGMAVDATALRHWLLANPNAAAALDVHEPEPFGPSYPLVGVPHARLLPHTGAATAAAHRAMSWVVKDVWRVLSGEKPEWPAP